jgi:hypothetical protein
MSIIGHFSSSIDLRNFKNAMFWKQVLLSSSKTIQLSQLGPLERANLNPWI